MNPILPILGITALVFLLGKKSNAATPPAGAAALPSGASPGGSGVAPPASVPATKPSPTSAPTNRPTSELSEHLRQQMAEALGRLGVNPSSGQIMPGADAEAIRYATGVIGQLKAEGFHEAAKYLQNFTDLAAKTVQTPEEAAPVAAALPAGLTQEQKEYIARIMTLSRDPNAIASLIEWMKKLAPSPERDTAIQMAQALALQLAAAQSTAGALGQIEEVIKASTPEAVAAAAAAAPVALPSIPITPMAVPSPSPVPISPAASSAPTAPTVLDFDPSKMPLLKQGMSQPKAIIQLWQRNVGVTADGIFGPNTTAATKRWQTGRGLVADGIVGPKSWYAFANKPLPATAAQAATSSLPNKPVVVPSRPVPQPMPASATPEEIAARNMMSHLTLVQSQKGVTGAKGKEDKMLVKKFQGLVGTTADGLAGPTTFILAAGKGAVNLPFVYYWPKNATAKMVLAYRESLNRIADKMASLGRNDEANQLRQSASRERGQSGIQGAMPA